MKDMSFKIQKTELGDELREDILFNSDKITKPTDVKIHGRTLVNLLGRRGNIRHRLLKEFNAVDRTLTYNSENASARIIKKSYAENSFLLCWNPADVIGQDKNYIVLCDARVVEGNAYIHMTPSGGKPFIDGYNFTNSRTFKTIYFTTSKDQSGITTDKGRYYIDLSANGETAEGDTFEVKNFRIYEISDELFEKINVEEEFSGDKIIEQFQYVDDIKCVRNPYIEVKQNLVPLGTIGTTADMRYPNPTIDNCNYPNVVSGSFTVKPDTEYAIYIQKDELIVDGSTIFIYFENETKTQWDRIETPYTEYVTVTTPSYSTKMVVLLQTSPQSLEYQQEYVENARKICDMIKNGKLSFTVVEGTEAKDIKDCFNSRIMFETDLYDGETIYKDNDGSYYKNSEWESLEITGDRVNDKTIVRDDEDCKVIVFPDISYPTNSATDSSIDENDAFMVRYDGEVMKTHKHTGDFEEYKQYESWHFGGCAVGETNYLYMTVPNSLTGWGKGYIPTTEEVRAFFPRMENVSCCIRWN